MTPSETKKFIQKQFEDIFNRGKLELADEVYSPTVVIHDPNNPGLAIGPEGIKQLYRQEKAGFPDLTYEIQSIIVEGNEVAMRWKASGTHKGTFMGLAPTGKFGTVTGQSMAHIENDRIAEVWLQWDAIGMLRNLGIELPIKAVTEAFV